jgi:formyltetrahydrofolate deformylase
MNTKNTAILLLSCEDQKGIVSHISNFIFQHDGNILNSEQHSDSLTNTFFMRLEWDLNNFKIAEHLIEQEFGTTIAKKFNMKFSLKFSKNKTNSAIFVSKYDHCLIDLLLRNSVNEINTNFKLIISNHLDLQKIAKHYGIDFAYFAIDANNKAEQEKKELKILQDYKIDLIILARYMQVLSNDFIKHYTNQIINIHHSFLPAFAGAKPYKQAFDRGVKLIGATSHFVTQELDNGPIIEQDVIRISHKDSETDLVQKGRDLEKSVLSKAVKLYLDNKVLVHNQKTIVF